MTDSNHALFAAVIERMKAEDCEFFVDSRNRPTVSIPGGGHQVEWLANSERVSDYLVSVFYELEGGRLPKTSELRGLRCLIREECRMGGRKLSEHEGVEVERDILVMVVILLLSREDHFTGRTRDLHLRLVNLIQEVSPFSDGLPDFVGVFSRRLRRSIPVLNGYGVDVRIEHKEDGSHTTLIRNQSFQPDDTHDELRMIPSDANSRMGNGLPRPDEIDGNLRQDSRTEESADSRSETSKEGGVK